MRYFGIMPGYGVVTSPDVQIYMLEEEVIVENEIGTYVLRDAFVLDGEMVARGWVHFNSDDQNTWRPGGPTTEIALLQNGEDTHVCLAGYHVEFPQDINFKIDMEPFEPYVEPIEMPSDGESVWDMTLDWAGVQFPLHFKLSGTEDYRRYEYQMGEKGGVLAIPRVEREKLSVELYPLYMKEADTEEEVSSAEGEASAGSWDSASYDFRIEDVTAVAPDGKEIKGTRSPNTAGLDEKFAQFDFEDVQPGEYIIRIPSLQLVYPYNDGMRIPINLETCQWEDVEYEIPGGRVSVECCIRLDAEDEECEKVAIPDDYKGESFSYWKIGLRYRMDGKAGETPGAPQILYLYGECPVVNHEKFYMESVFDRNEIGDGYEERIVGIMDGAFDISRFELVPESEVTVPWKCDFNIPITVEIPE